ncbi:MAG TPA: 50S ribosomal protein L2 [Elusimicrobiota bacterium]|nr:50S ribosomal protein L2 [Elusimicrobiota bacterium]HMU74736.1 50S ribosomal protein L2 [Elusimicrobiota bacterium]HMU95763.1 50S ribosomal protein L2 [Elusimicrobiota bacterium]HMX93739.1 50S ribosomal protein L2 [Elusimicrobiota bacterium]HMZ25815.1 50S ribosomal protein L2 [Elusimicrobiota bacterium]
MPMKSFKAYTPSRRFITVEDFSEITKTTPEKALLRPLTKKGGRNNTGQVMVRFRGGGHKRMYRVIDFKREKFGVPAKVAAIEYDPNRSARLALLHYRDGEKRYILQPVGIKPGDVLMSGPTAEIKNGNALPLANIPVGTIVHAVEMVPGNGAQFARSAGASVQIMAREGGYVTIKMPSGEIRLVPDGGMATIGQVGNTEHENLTIGNAGRNRHRGFKSHVRGTAMNAVDHPHGGGRGRSKGNNQPRSPWNQPAKGYKTRSDKQHHWMIIRRRTDGAEQA